MGNLRRLISAVFSFLFVDIWRLRLTRLSGRRSFFIRHLRVVLLALRGFDENKCQLRAATLTFYSLLSIVPVAAMAFVIAKGLGIEPLLQRQLLAEFVGYEPLIYKIITFAHTLLETTRGGTLAGFGGLLLFLAVVAVIGHLEAAFKEIWDDDDRRHWAKKCLDYAIFILVAPAFVIVSSSATIFLTTQFEMVTHKFALLGMVSPLFHLGLKLVPYLLTWMLLAFIYITIPHTRVPFKSGMRAAIVAGTLYQLAQWTFILFQVKLSRYNAIYGSFAALPVLIIWLQLSWLIILFGAEIAFAHEYQETYEFEADIKGISPYFKRLLMLYVAHFCVMHRMQKKPPLSAETISETLDIPYRLVSHILHKLTACDFLADVSDNSPISLYTVKGNIKRLTIASLLDTIDQAGSDNLPVVRNDHFHTLSRALEGFRAEIRSSRANRRFMDI